MAEVAKALVEEQPGIRLDTELEEGEVVASQVLEKIPDAPKKHPLESPWTFWFDNPNGKQKQSTWGTSLRPVYTFGTVEDFWCLYNNVLQPSRLIAGADFHCFKYGIEPKWEDPKCASGGKWTASPPRNKAILDTFWLHTLLAMIGEQFDEGEEICGAVVSVRARQDKLALWTKNAQNEAAQLSIARQWKDVLDYSEKIGFIFHDDAKRQDKQAKNRYMV
eukprot:TRINITY_DN5794_c0_g1_i1.p1 TRINITY_DN5794_c0_g1~~TRINITY_DN5794_c0_g1_i1.p1  ORF type:complete len:220 (+),score=39.65 TRINITY_DN5794_c0_g1_i1:155-814(+)